MPLGSQRDTKVGQKLENDIRNKRCSVNERNILACIGPASTYFAILRLTTSTRDARGVLGLTAPKRERMKVTVRSSSSKDVRYVIPNSSHSHNWVIALPTLPTGIDSPPACRPGSCNANLSLCQSMQPIGFSSVYM